MRVKRREAVIGFGYIDARGAEAGGLGSEERQEELFAGVGRGGLIKKKVVVVVGSGCVNGTRMSCLPLSGQ